ncbi:726_t:CDS:1 [Acaulospora colombiana]|uniref:726_t:CDS:1 n=1 Tax=Acaulospora colombiana TaxID=27376 RepID=A0ACA9NQ48_9GLOM|nr:726_t:CDS:1 [Acaulospora colombiana]
MSQDIYALIVSGECFKLTKDQLESDPGNYLATYFLGDFAEATDGVQELHISKEPKLFTLIQAHLRGYTIFPIPDSIVPPYMTKETTIENLILEAEFYGLEILEEKA